MSGFEVGPLAALIGRHRAGRSYDELAKASGGVISASEWELFEQQPLRCKVPLDPKVVQAFALVLGLSHGMVRHYALASRGLPAAAGLGRP
jgi:hypothetical protein